jgi:hypothetical protein
VSESLRKGEDGDGKVTARTLHQNGQKAPRIE